MGKPIMRQCVRHIEGKNIRGREAPFMRTPSPTFTLVLFLNFFLLVSSVAGEAQESQNDLQAKQLWEQAIAAKGGRAQLYRVNSLVMSYQETVRNFTGIVVHRGLVERLYVFPNKVWGWEDGLPPPFHVSVGWLNVERNLRCTMYAGASAPVCGQAKQGVSSADEGINQAQYLYLMETRWVKPIPLSVTNGSIGLKKVDVLHTRFENKKVDYFLDRKTHLPLRVAVFYNDSERATLTIDLSDYVIVSGIQMPSKQKRGRVSFQINAPYDDSLFSRPPSVDAGPKAWRQPVKPT